MAPHTHVPAPRNTIETYSARPEREPPRNENGEIICTHDACRDKTETFRRPCEWNKHMDKHERPYKCSEPTCEQNPGFTYSGGLLRHMREVHKKGVGPARRPLFCPHANCIRSTGEGFTRRENLEEHLRRRHSYTGHYSPPPQSISDQNEENPDQPRKRRKTVDPDSPNGDQVNQQAQQSGQQLPDLQRDSLRADLQRAYHMNGDLDLDQLEANRQLSLARQTIVEQQELIRRQDEELHHLRSTLHGAGMPVPYPTHASERGYPPPSPVPASLPAHLQQPEQYQPESPSQAPQVDGNINAAAQNAALEAVTDPALRDLPVPAPSASPQPKVDKDMLLNGNGSEPSRRIEIARDLVSEKLAAAATATATA
ncbi:hypothetical protein PMZ80_003850 [Knufia obscura]|uniref:C2H2-type domain-containing protein n=2 Tax=Knufia TaxID=430999 RepID=A0AAN8I924_9EURO|nr:hypothetical protein PMZ80_003850 [Knufia obscura]KAK5958234.1 hypothetical protein OHC33_000076 [Knufia fluminis]